MQLLIYKSRAEMAKLLPSCCDHRGPTDQAERSSSTTHFELGAHVRTIILLKYIMLTPPMKRAHAAYNACCTQTTETVALNLTTMHVVCKPTETVATNLTRQSVCYVN